MKNKQIVEELKKFNSDDTVKITIFSGKKSMDEINYVGGTWEDKNYTCEARTNWRSAELFTNEMTVEDIIKVLKKKELSDLDEDDFSGLQLISASDGSTDVYDIDWDVELTEEEKELAPSGMDMYWEGNINDSIYEFYQGGIAEMKIEIGDYSATIN